MTLRKIAISLAAIPALVAFVACNEKYEPVEVSLSSAVVRTFSLSANDSILANLDSVFFSIDLVKGRIFNADSLPAGTDVTRLVPVITTLEGASLIELKVNRSVGADTTYNYLTNSTDSIDFTNPVMLRIVSPNGVTECNYTITVNVHKMVADSLAWGDNEAMKLPTSFISPDEQRTVRRADDILCLSRKGSGYCIGAHIGNINDLNGKKMDTADWDKYAISFPFQPVVSSFSATDEALFILDTAGQLYRSDNDGRSWTATGLTWNYIYGGYQSKLLGSVHTAAGWQVQSYPDMQLSELPDGMPVENTSVPVSYQFPMSDNPQIMIVGGRKSDGSLVSTCWGYDGSSWAKISKRNLPEALESVTVAPYYSVNVSTNWTVQTFPTLVAMGGRNSDGIPSSTVYISNDYGFTWAEASQLMQLPSEMGSFYDAQAYVMSSVFTASVVVPMISKPSETWDCPYIYLFGGINASGSLRDSVWRGVINRLSFRPVE